MSLSHTHKATQMPHNVGLIRLRAAEAGIQHELVPVLSKLLVSVIAGDEDVKLFRHLLSQRHLKNGAVRPSSSSKSFFPPPRSNPKYDRNRATKPRLCLQKCVLGEGEP